MTKPLFITAVIARLPLAMLTIGVLVHVQSLTGSYGAAGAAGGVLAAAQGAGGPALGRLADRRGQTVVLIGSSTLAAAALGTLAVVPADAPLGMVLALAAALGLATPPVGACLRALIPALFPDTQRRTYAVDTACAELTWVAGPPLALGVGTLWGSGTALAAAAGALGHTAAAGPLLGLWGVGSLLGGIVAARLGGGAGNGRVFAGLLSLLGLGHAALGTATGSVVALGLVITAAGTMIAPVLASAYAMVDDAAAAGTVTEAFAWLATASAIGTSIGAAAGGALADSAGPAAAFLLAGGAGLAAAAVAAVARRGGRRVCGVRFPRATAAARLAVRPATGGPHDRRSRGPVACGAGRPEGHHRPPAVADVRV